MEELEAESHGGFKIVLVRAKELLALLPDHKPGEKGPDQIAERHPVMVLEKAVPDALVKEPGED